MDLRKHTEKIRPTYAVIDLERLRENLRLIKNRLKNDTGLAAVVKANAYGHGSVEISRELDRRGVEMLCVATVEEGFELRDEGVECPVLVMGTVGEDQFELALEKDIQVNVYQPDKLKKLNRTAKRKNKKAEVHLKVDSGMGRIGFRHTEVGNMIDTLSDLKHLKVKGVFTNFARSDEPESGYTEKQTEQFNQTLSKLKESGIEPEIKHCANSAGFIHFPESHFDMVRAGITLYGLYPSENVKKIGVEPVMSVISHIQHIKEVPEGTPIGYGGNYVTPSKRKIATIPIGYDDGIHWCLSDQLEVLIDGKRVPAAGRVSMDMTTIDVSDVKNPSVGDRVIILGESDNKSISGMEHARKAGTIPYEIICHIGKRIPRFYVDDGEVIGAASAFNGLLDSVENHSSL